MSVPYTIRVGMGQLAAASTVTLYTVPAGFVTILRDITISGHGGTLSLVKFGVVGSPAQPVIMAITNANSYQQWTGRWALQAGEQLVGQTQGTGVCDYQITGYLLSAS